MAGVKGGVKLDHQGGAKPDHYGNGEGFVLLDLRGWLERRPAPPLGGAFRPEWKAPLQIVATCRQGKSGTTFGGQASAKTTPRTTVGRLIDDHHRFCTEVCAGREYARTIPPKNSPAYPLSDSQALRDAMNRIGEAVNS